MGNSMLNNWPIDPAVVIIALGVITLLLLIMTVICIMQTSRLYRRYDYFMRGKDAESMEEIILNLLDEVKELYGFDTAAIVDMEEVVECLYNKECNGKVVIDDTLKAAIDAYYEQYGAK